MTRSLRDDLAARYPVWRFRDGNVPERADDLAVVEEPLEIRVAGRAVGITMRTPGHDAELALGFLVGEGIITRRADVEHVRPCDRAGGEVIDVIVSPGVAVDFARLTRHVFAPSSCGVCGSGSIDALRKQFPKVGDGPRAEPSVVYSLMDGLRRAQPTFDLTGGLHAAGLFDQHGTLLAAREDVGRHNAVDKVVGHAFLGSLLPLSRHVLVVSGRASFEIVQKALAAGIPIVAAVSAPSSLAIDLADESGLTLIGFLRDGRFNVYTHAKRILE
ncbi:MAG: formate dehydrogenase accessory sulfurtransferase FdhD [Phycisphaerales bacterium]|nr:formate dehydrogenase accessory sulfurtransferase FdhD [Phycisphaerales bacterium]